MIHGKKVIYFKEIVDKISANVVVIFLQRKCDAHMNSQLFEGRPQLFAAAIQRSVGEKEEEIGWQSFSFS